MKIKAAHALSSQTRAATALRLARRDAGLSLRQLAVRAGTSHSTLLAYESGRKSPSVDTFTRIVEACGFDVDFALSRRVRARDGVQRGHELEQALVLAAQFPVRHLQDPGYPRFGRSARPA